MAAPLGNHDAGVSLGGPAEEDAQQIRSLELEAAVDATDTSMQRAQTRLRGRAQEAER